ncbi:hypothetical protein HPB52_009060 [Rhipicephalus sanguineus]|uniref:CCHC-type domain-containing protein n=1 Tax=Rhipicephalus sanguineus TaxID=34632 RepID=A0A9D4PYW7_RHISA|nr:hypothetical protein HPB52_009060 [Rhipicephalus sanguineus]
MGCSKFLVCTRNTNQATRLMVAEGFRINSEKVTVEGVGPPVAFVNVYRYPAYLSDEVLTNALAQYGKVNSVTFATVASRQNKLNGVRVVRMKMSRPAPNFSTIAGHRVMFEYRDMRRVCARCGYVRHMASACSSPYCKRCGAFGHDTDGCEAECKRCGGKHCTRECFWKRTYVAAARGFPPATGTPPPPPPPTRPAHPPRLTCWRRHQASKCENLTPPPTFLNVRNYWDSEGSKETDVPSAATTSPAPPVVVLSST